MHCATCAAVLGDSPAARQIHIARVAIESTNRIEQLEHRVQELEAEYR